MKLSHPLLESLPPPLNIREEGPEDEPFLRCLFESARADLGILPDEVREGIIDLQYRAQRDYFRRHFPDASYLVVLLGGEPVGRIALHIAESTHLIDIAILPEFRSRGIGTSLLSGLAGDRDISLEVLATNRAKTLYERLGFLETGRSETHIQMTRPKSGL